jgi:hypothetical protein
MPTKYHSQNRSEFEKRLLKNILYFTAVRFRGRGTYDRVKTPTLKAARLAGQKLGRAMIYAVCRYCGHNHSIHLENVEN